MSSSTVGSVVLFISALALTMAARYADDSAPVDRAPNSISKKDALFGSPRSSVLRHTEKIRGPLEASLEMIGEVPEKQGDVFVLKGFVRSDANVENVDFKWALPKNVEIVNGSVTGHISLVQAGQPVEVQLTLKSLEAVNHQIHLIASGGQGTTRFAASAQYNTLLQQVLAESKEALLKSTERDAKAQKASSKQKNLKVFH